MAFAAERALDLVGHSALLPESTDCDAPVCVTLLLLRSFHDLIQITETTVAIGGTRGAVEPPIRTFLDDSLR